MEQQHAFKSASPHAALVAPLLCCLLACGLSHANQSHGGAPATGAGAAGTNAAGTNAAGKNAAATDAGAAADAAADVTATATAPDAASDAGLDPTQLTMQCGQPTQDTVVYELDAANCKQRAVQACVAGYATKQGAFDATLMQLLDAEHVSLGDVSELAVQVDVVDGCPTRFYCSLGSRMLPELGPSLSVLLAAKRFACAAALSCAVLPGPSTIATQ